MKTTHCKPNQGTSLPLRYTIFSAVMPISVLSLAPCDLLNSKIMLHAVPSCSFPPRGNWASKDTAESWAQLIPRLCTGSACDILMMVPSFTPPSFILWGQNTLFLLIKKKGSQHTSMSLPEQDPEDFIQPSAPKTHLGPKHPMQDIGKEAF